MLDVKTPEEALELIFNEFSPVSGSETVSLENALGRTLAADLTASEYVPDFDRSTVDGYAVRARDTFGCSDSMPALLNLAGHVHMGEPAGFQILPDTCADVPTGGALPEGADAMVMVEYTEDYGDGTIGILKSAAPGSNLIFRGDDVCPGQTILTAGSRITPQAIGAMAAMGITRISVTPRLKAGIISTGDELVPADQAPGPGQIRDVNSSLLAACMQEAGTVPVSYGMIRDDAGLLAETLEKAISECDLVLISGGSSVGAKDATCQVIRQHGRILFHGIAMKPGKPTILGTAQGKPVFGLPGHPAAAFFVTKRFVLPVLWQLTGQKPAVFPLRAVLDEPVSANHGRAQFLSVCLKNIDGVCHARPIRSKSGLISSLSASEGYFCISRDCEGLPAGTEIDVYLY